MASEVPTNELNVLVTCRFLLLNKLFTLSVQINMQLIYKVSIKINRRFPLIVCCVKKYIFFKGQSWPKNPIPYYIIIYSPLLTI